MSSKLCVFFAFPAFFTVKKSDLAEKYAKVIQYEQHFAKYDNDIFMILSFYKYSSTNKIDYHSGL